MFKKCDTCPVAIAAGVTYKDTKSKYNSRRDHCAASISPVFLSKNSIFRTESFLSAVFGVVCEGLLAVQHVLPDGRRCLSELFFRGDLIDMNRIPENAEIVALTDVEIRCFCATTFLNIRRSSDELDSSYFEQLGQQMKTMADHCVAVAKKTPPERIASFLLEYRRRKPAKNEDFTIIELDLQQKQIGDYLALEPETVSRTLALLASSEVITLLPKNRISIRDEEKLREISEGGMPRKNRANSIESE